LRNRKALDLIVENARVTDEEWRDEVLEDEASAARDTDTSAESTEQKSEADDEMKAQSSSPED
jgi:hypothetical protein